MVQVHTSWFLSQKITILTDHSSSYAVRSTINVRHRQVTVRVTTFCKTEKTFDTFIIQIVEIQGTYFFYNKFSSKPRPKPSLVCVWGKIT